MKRLRTFHAALLLAVGLVCAPAVAPADAGPDGGEDAGPAEEECNGLDDDDDGMTDEDLPAGAPCSNSQTDDPDEGICVEGWEICVGGEWICYANEPTPEICDNKDNDCDGMTDEDLDVECPWGICALGQCLEPCGGDKMLCPEGKVCEEVQGEWVCVPDVCNEFVEDHLDCVDNPYCCSDGFEPPCWCTAIEQLCVNWCHEITCPEGYVCVVADGGACHFAADADCYVVGCPEGRTCVDGECTVDPCRDVECEQPQYCNADGVCVSPCEEATCPDGVGCFEGLCVDDPCAGVLCEPELSCVGGLCVRGACWNVECEFYEVCVDGECVHDPCWNVECPNCAMCVDGACYEYAEPVGLLYADEWGELPVDTDTRADNGIDSYADSNSGPPFGMTKVLLTGAGGCMCNAGAGDRSPGLLALLGGLVP